MACIVRQSATKLMMTEADLFRAIFAHRGLPAPHLWREAYSIWCERDELPKNGYENWFLDTCIDIVCSKLVLLPISDSTFEQCQYRIDSLIEVKQNFDNEDDGN